MSNRAWLHLALEGRLKLRRSGLASPVHPCSYSTSKFRTSIILNLKHLQQASPSPGEHLGVSCWPHIKIIKACRLFADQNRSKTVAAKCWHQTSAGAGFASQKHPTCKIPSAPRITRLKDSWLHMISDMSRHRGMPWNPWHLINRIHINSLSSLGREDLGCANATIQRNSWRTMGLWVEYRWRYLFISKL